MKELFDKLFSGSFTWHYFTPRDAWWNCDRATPKPRAEGSSPSAPAIEKRLKHWV